MVFIFFEAPLWFYVTCRSIFLLAGLCFNLCYQSLFIILIFNKNLLNKITRHKLFMLIMQKYIILSILPKCKLPNLTFRNYLSEITPKMIYWECSNAEPSIEAHIVSNLKEHDILYSTRAIFGELKTSMIWWNSSWEFLMVLSLYISTLYFY